MNTVIEKDIGSSSTCFLPVDITEKSNVEIYNSWCQCDFLFKEENKKHDTIGLRSPQIGGIFASLAYEKADEKGAATVVMPTGTGKTETILSIVVAGKFRRTLVIVPSDALREQTKNKFIQLGLLRTLGLIGSDVQNPIVATIKHGVKDHVELERLLESNVIIATASALLNFPKDTFQKLTDQCSHLIVDEAHHITAKSWARVKACFHDKSVFQFTATPFRSDRSRIEGKIIFNYSLKKAQEDGYFMPIEFHPVKEFIDENSDKEIARKAIKILREDLKCGLDHMVMARASTIKRAAEIFEFYSSEKDLNPVLINSKVKRKSEVLEAIKNGEHKIIVCVDMLGEGFDLPQLKISAIHDPHKSINVMLQFTGRFTRTTGKVGNAKFIANIANPNVNDSLEELYRENSDWNGIISDISFEKIESEKDYQEFKREFSTPSKLLDLGLNPSISTTIYRMDSATWNPQSFHDFGSKNFQIWDSVINDDNNTLVFSVKSCLQVGWTSSKELFDESWDLYIAYYDASRELLFVHSSAKDGLVKRLINLIAKNASQIRGESVFRALAGLKRLKLQNVGLNKNKKGLRYSMHTGTEINEQIPDIEANRATKSNIFGKGYERGELVSIGCSYKGKIWAMDSDSLEKWIIWCDGVGMKILDETIDTNQVLKTAMQTEILTEFPSIPVLSVDWPVQVLRKNESKIKIVSTFWEESILNCELTVTEPLSSDSKMLTIDLKSSHGNSSVEARINTSGDVSFTSTDNLEIVISDRKEKLSDFFNEYPPTLFLADTSVVDGGYRYYSPEIYAYSYDKNNTEEWNWAGVDISIESQRESKIKESIQYHTIQKIKNNYDVIFDDDGSGEVADIVAIKNIGDKELVIDLYHCKYCSKKNGVATPGARIDDVYQVAGQAEKSVKWFSNKEKLISRLMERERGRLKDGKASRIDKGCYEDLVNLAKVARYAAFKLGIVIVQPAISKVKVSDDQLAVLGATAAYIDEVCGVKLKVIINK